MIYTRQLMNNVIAVNGVYLAVKATLYPNQVRWAACTFCSVPNLGLAYVPASMHVQTLHKGRAA